MDLNALKDAAIEALTKLFAYFQEIIENFINDKLPQ